MSTSEEPVPVEVHNEEPLKVEIEAPTKTVRTSSGKISLVPTTTEQEDIVAEGQRRVNLIWEFTQASIAVMVTMAVIGTAILGVDNVPIINAFFLVIGFYFSRTNHSAIGGVGRKPSPSPYQGR